MANINHSATAGGHVYVANYIAQTVSQYTVGLLGELVPLSPPALSLAGLAPGELGLTPTGQNLYISLTDTSGTGKDRIAQFSVGGTGGLTPLSPPSVATAAGPLEIAISPDGKFMYVDNGSDGVISQYSIGATGALAPLSPASVTPAGEAGELTMSPDGKFLYVGGTTISQFSINTVTGQLTALSPATAGARADDMKISRDGKFLYAGGFGVSQYSIGADGQLTGLTPPVISDTLGILELEITGNGKFVYATAIDGQGASRIAQYSIGPNGSLSALAPATVSTGNLAVQAVISPDSNFLYVGNMSFSTPNLPDTISQYSIGPSGNLSPLSPLTVPTGAGAGGLVATPPTALSVAQVIPTTTAYTGATSGTVGKVVSLAAKLTVTESGVSIPGMALVLTLNGTETCTGVTAADGTVACSVQPNEKAGTYPVTATFAGTPVYSASSASAQLVLKASLSTVGPPQQPLVIPPTTTRAPGVTSAPPVSVADGVPVSPVGPVVPVSSLATTGVNGAVPTAAAAGLILAALLLLGWRRKSEAG